MRSGAWLLLLLLLTSTAALAEGSSTLARAQRSYDELRYDEAAALLQAALESEALSTSEVQQALLLKGIVEVVRGDDAEARASFRTLLEAAPDATLPSGLSPKITSVFDEVRASLPPASDGQGSDTAAVDVSEPPVPTTDVAAQTNAASPMAGQPKVERNLASEGEDDAGLSALAVGVAAGSAVAAVIVVAGAGALLFFAREQPPESSLGTLQLP